MYLCPISGASARSSKPLPRIPHRSKVALYGWDVVRPEKRKLARELTVAEVLAMRRIALLLAAFLLVVSALAAQRPGPPPGLRLKVGDLAPAFTLKDQNGNNVSLHQFRGKKSVALAFYVFAFTGG